MKAQTVLMSGVLAAGALSVASVANAGVIVLSDNFSQDTTGAGTWPGDSVFRSVSPPENSPRPASVDLYRDNIYGQSAVDLDGSTGWGNLPFAGELRSVMSLPTGTYEITFELATRNIPHPETTVISIGGQSFSISPPRNQPFTSYTHVFSNVSGQVSFADLGPSTQGGNFITDIAVTTVLDIPDIPDIPETATRAMMALGFVGLGYAGFRRRPAGRLA
jgi:hypothetical protein